MRASCASIAFTWNTVIVDRSIKTLALCSAVAITLGCARQAAPLSAPLGGTNRTHELDGERAHRDPARPITASLAGGSQRPPFRQTGIASWYGSAFHGRHTANGESFNAMALTAAHRTLPLGAFVKVTCFRSRKSVVVRINDRGPFRTTRIIDLSYAAAVALGIQHSGTAKVEIERVSAATHPRSPKKRRV